MQITATFFFCVILLVKFFILEASYVINLLESVTKAIDPYHKKFYGFMCWEDEDQLRMLIKTFNRNFTTIGLNDISSGNNLHHPQFVTSTFVMDFACPGVGQLWQSLDLEYHLSKKFILLNVDEDEVSHIMAHQKGLGSTSEVYVIIGQHEIRKVIKHEFRSKITFETYATWLNNSLEIVKPKSEFITKDRYNLLGASIRVCIVIPRPDTINHLTDGVDLHIDTNTKQGYVLTQEILQFLNANVNYSYVTTWGYYNASSGTWNGLLEKLLNNDADIGGTQMFVTTSRVPLIHYVYLTSPAFVSFMFQNPRLSFTDNLFLLPFSKITWICVILLIPIFAFGITFIEYFAEWKFLSGSAKNRTQDGPSIGESIYIVLTIVCQQGFTKPIDSVSGRTLMFFSFFTVMLIFVAYTASIVALLQSSSTRINTLQDLLDSNMKLGSEDTPYNRIYFPMQTEPVRKAIYEKKLINRDGSKNFLPIVEGIKKMKNEEYAFHTLSGTAYTFISKTFSMNEKCRLNTINYLNVEPYSVIRKNATYKEMIIVSLARINEHGILRKVSEKFYTKKPTCTGSSVVYFAITFNDVQPAFVLLGFGYGLSFVLFLMEIFFARYKQNRNKNKMSVFQPIELEILEIE